MKPHEKVFHKAAGSHLVPGTIANSKAPLGQGDRFQALKKKLSTKPGIGNPSALAASIGRKKYGNKKFAQLAINGKKNA